MKISIEEFKSDLLSYVYLSSKEDIELVSGGKTVAVITAPEKQKAGKTKKAQGKDGDGQEQMSWF